MFDLSFFANEQEGVVFERIYEAYRQKMFFLALSILEDDMEAEDVVHDVFFQVASKHMQKISEMRRTGDVRAYLLQATRNTALNVAKKKSRIGFSIDKMSEEDVNLNPSLQEDDSFVDDICHKYDYTQVIEAMKRLGPKYADVLYQHFVSELSASEIASLTGDKVTAVKKQLIRGKRMLMVILENLRR